MLRIANGIQHFMGIIVGKAETGAGAFVFIVRFYRVLQTACLPHNGLCQEDVQLVILGTGEERYENMFRHFDWKYNDKVSANIYYMPGKVRGHCPVNHLVPLTLLIIIDMLCIPDRTQHLMSVIVLKAESRTGAFIF